MKREPVVSKPLCALANEAARCVHGNAPPSVSPQNQRLICMLDGCGP